MNTETNIRFGILCNGRDFQDWQLKAIEHLLNDPRFELCLIITDKTNYPAKPFLQKLSSNFLYNQYETRFIKPTSRSRKPLGNAFDSVRKLACVTIPSGKFGQQFNTEDLALIQSENLDFIIRFGFNILKGEILNAAKWGIWSYHHGNPEEYRGGPPGFWEILHGKKTMGAILQRLTPKLDQGIVLHKGIFPTVMHSYGEMIDRFLYGTSTWLRNAALQIHFGNLDPEIGIYEIKNPGPVYKRPSNLLQLNFSIQLFFNRLKFYRGKYLWRDMWTVGVVDCTAEQLVNGQIPSEINWMPEPEDKQRFYADPFPFPSENGTGLLFEEYDYSQKKAWISKSAITPNDQFLPVKPILEEGTHLSYPFVIEQNGTMYFSPESWQLNKVSLHQIHHPTLSTDLISDGSFIDPSIINYNGNYWLFCTMRQAPSHQLYLFYSDELSGPYKAHQLNPVKTDVTNSRPGGTPFIHNGKLYRPAQNCSETYGGSVVINEVLELSTTAFSEVVVNEIKPSPEWKYNRGLHTVTLFQGKLVFDAKLEQFYFNPKGN